MNLPRIVRPVGAYLALLFLSLVVAAWAWQERVCGVLYYCSDSLPWELFCPGPFAHLAVEPFGHTGDYYVVSEEHLERLRWVFLAVAAVVPALLLWPIRLLARHLTRRSSERLMRATLVQESMPPGRMSRRSACIR